jgi:FixJ family two-component response regulator
MLNVSHIYVVADDPVLRQSLRRRLETGNFRCHCFASVTALLERMSELIDGCILLDDTISGQPGVVDTNTSSQGQLFR